MADIQEVLREMRRSSWKEMPLCGTVLRWVNAIEAAMREPVAYYWMSSKWHCHEVHMATDLPCNTPYDIRPLFTFPPDAAGEIERLKSDYRQVLREVNEQAVMLLGRANEIERLNEALAASRAENSRLRRRRDEIDYEAEEYAEQVDRLTKVLEVIRAALAGKERSNG